MTGRISISELACCSPVLRVMFSKTCPLGDVVDGPKAKPGLKAGFRKVSQPGDEGVDLDVQGSMPMVTWTKQHY